MPLKNLNEIKNQSQEKYKREFISDDYILDNEFIRNFKRISGNDIVYHKSYAEATSAKSLKIFIPYQWFIIASFFIEYYQELINYKKAIETAKGNFKDFDNMLQKCRNNEELSKTVVNTIQGKTSKEKEFLVKFLCDYGWWGGVKKGKTIDRKDFYVSPIMNLAGLVNNTQAFVAEIAKEFAERPQITNLFSYRKVNTSFSSEFIPKLSKPNTSIPISHAQIIYYGVPGCGKSYKVNKDINKKLEEHNITDKEYHKVRCVFHPEYSNADFVGQIFPKIEEKTNADGSSSSVVVYEFKPGPFTEIIRRAYQNPDDPFFLIVEEINRGNSAAIFGETFQLLDRIKKDEPIDNSTENTYCEGWSSYGIDNQDINAYIRDQQRKNTDKQKGHCLKVDGGCSSSEQEEKIRLYPFVNIISEKLNTSWVHKEGDEVKQEMNKLHFTANTAIRLPPNLSIYATMNTSDQNVFTMDNAFQRRFKFKMIENELDNAAQYDIIIGRNNENETSTEVRWGSFRKWINKKILSQNTTLSKSEDKCLGGWFIASDAVNTDENGKVTEYENISREDFAEKVLKYLWYDIFKRNTGDAIFNKDTLADENGIVSFAKVTKTFKDVAGFEAFKKVFKIDEKDEAELKKTYAESNTNP